MEDGAVPIAYLWTKMERWIEEQSGNRTGAFRRVAEIPAGDHPVGLAAGDLDGDGILCPFFPARGTCSGSHSAGPPASSTTARASASPSSRPLRSPSMDLYLVCNERVNTARAGVPELPVSEDRRVLVKYEHTFGL